MGFKDPLRYMEDGMPGAEEVRFQSVPFMDCLSWQMGGK